MYRQIIVPTEKDHTIALPEYLFGKQVEVVVNEVEKKNNFLFFTYGLEGRRFLE